MRVTSDDDDMRMPPEGESLTDSQIETIRNWIAGGANYQMHWAYRPLAVAETRLESDSWIRNEIDFFVKRNLDNHGIAPSPRAGKAMLAKRLYYDLLGLPPDPDEIQQFLTNDDAAAYETLVDRLLASHHFGERWGRHWLDKARYADSDGYEKDNHRKDAWRYRDWVIDAINEDMPFDQFTIEQLAGDLLPNADYSARLATAFNRQTLTNTEGGTDREQWRVAAVMDRTETLGIVWLGLTVGCARCHNHKYDAISQDEYYRLFALFNNADEVSIDLAQTDAQQKEKVRVLAERKQDRRTTFVMHRGDFLQPQHEVQPGMLASLSPPERTAQDRLAMARWLVSEGNPLAARVAVNHVWGHLFGEGLVRTVNDFGVRGERPTHPELLDWLAAEFQSQNWSRKALVKRIVMSATYQQTSVHRPELAETDPANRLLHRQNRFRVEAEIVRDITLSAAGLLSDKIGGPSVFPPIPSSVTDLTYNSSFKWEESKGEDRFRRGMYTYFKRTAPHPNLITFDCPDSNVTNVKRSRSNTPIAALVTLNNQVFAEAAVAFAEKLLCDEQLQQDVARLETLLQTCLVRRPLPAEVERLGVLLAQTRAHYKSRPAAAQRVLEQARNAGFNGQDEHPGELAAWAAVTRVALNLDEFLTRE